MTVPQMMPSRAIPAPAPPRPSPAALTIPATPFAGPYLSHLLTETLTEPSHAASELAKLTHLNCSFLGGAAWGTGTGTGTGTAPTLEQLKQHAQALANLIRTVDARDVEFGGDAFDYLDDLDEPYRNEAESHRAPLRGVVNTLVVEEGGDVEDAVVKQACPLARGADEEGEEEVGPGLAQHVNECLEVLDDRYAEYGGLFALLPREESEARTQADDTVLGQWLAYTTRLVARVAELEGEVARTRDLLAGEAVVPYHLRDVGEGRDGKVLLFPQDRWALGGLSSELWEVVNARLAKRQVELEGERREMGRLGMEVDVGKEEGGSKKGRLAMTAYVDVTSRFYRLGGGKTIFILPAFGINPATEGTRKLEATPMVQTVVRPVVEERVTARRRHQAARLKVLGDRNGELEGLLGEKEDVIRDLEAHVGSLDAARAETERKKAALEEELRKYNTMELKRQEETKWEKEAEKKLRDEEEKPRVLS
ncbi:MAG: hypothetical protein M1833_001963 [Piccolia ochrophora]|nr:MAG: hypothetical protein M1833_001963 [Piccolia ochrophora]